MPLHAPAAVASLLLVSACAVVRPIVRPTTLEGTTVQTTYTDFVAAMANADTVGLILLLDSAVVLHTADNQAIVNRREIARRLLGAHLGSGRHAVAVARRSAETCVGAIMQEASYSISRQDSSGTAGVESGQVALLWIDWRGNPRITEIALDRADANARGRIHAPCPSFRVARFNSRRFEIAAFPDVRFPGWRTIDALERDMAALGWTRDAALPALGDKTGRNELHVRGRVDDYGSPLVTIGARMSQHVRVEGAVQVRAASGGLASYHPQQSSMLEQRFSSRVMMGTLQAAWPYVRVGAGPVYVSSHWSERYEKIIKPTPAPGQPEYYKDFSVPVTENTWSPHAFGAAGQLEIVYPLTSSLLLRASAWSWLGTSMRFSGVPTHANWSASPGASYLGIGVGWAW